VSPVHIRKLTNAEYDAAVQNLLGFESHEGTGFASDVRNGLFTPSLLQRIDDTRADQLQRAGEALAKRAVAERLEALVPCHESASVECAERSIARFAARAFRRPIDAEECNDLLAVGRGWRSIRGGSLGCWAE
jgi:hypothetical protein